MSKRRILIIEDHAALREMVVAYLKSRYDVYEAETAEAGITLAKKEAIDLIITDVSLERRADDGLRVIEKLRAEGCQVPIIAMSGQKSETIAEQCVRAGAQVYLQKPFKSGLLVALVDRHVATPQARATISPFVDGQRPPSQPFTFGTATIDTEYNIHFPGRPPLGLGPKPIGILQYFATHAGHLVKRNELLAAIWGEDADQHSNSINTYVSTLRKLFAENGDDFSKWVQPEVRVGWRISAEAGSARAA